MLKARTISKRILTSDHPKVAIITVLDSSTQEQWEEVCHKVWLSVIRIMLKYLRNHKTWKRNYWEICPESSIVWAKPSTTFLVVYSHPNENSLLRLCTKIVISSKKIALRIGQKGLRSLPSSIGTKPILWKDLKLWSLLLRAIKEQVSPTGLKVASQRIARSQWTILSGSSSWGVASMVEFTWSRRNIQASFVPLK